MWKSRSETDWPPPGNIARFLHRKKNRSILILTSTCWQEISLSNAVELTTVIPQKEKICRFKRRFLPVFENSRCSIVCLRAANPVTCPDWAVLFLRRLRLLAVKLKRAPAIQQTCPAELHPFKGATCFVLFERTSTVTVLRRTLRCQCSDYEWTLDRYNGAIAIDLLLLLQ